MDQILKRKNQETILNMSTSKLQMMQKEDHYTVIFIYTNVED